jgi:hypothetical protein
MSDRSITIATVTAAPFIDCGKQLTPRLQLVVGYTTGGTSMITGHHFSRGYEISVRHDRKSHEGWTSFIIDGKGNPTACIETAARFSQKTLDKIAHDVRAGKHNDLIERLYAKARSNRSEYEWPESILPQSQTVPSDELQLA